MKTSALTSLLMNVFGISPSLAFPPEEKTRWSTMRTPLYQATGEKVSLRNLYGMKQASRCWHKDINDFLITTMRMKSLSSTHCIYLKKLSESDWLVIILYVDDLLICSNIDEVIEEAFRQLGKWKIH